MVFARVRNQDYIAGRFSTDFVGGDQLPGDETSLRQDDRGPAQAGDGHDRLDRDIDHSLSFLPKAINHGKDLLLRASKPQVENIAQQILIHHSVKDSYSGPAMPELLYRLFYKIFVTDKKFRVKDNCIGCSACAKLCPMANIRMNDRKPVWQGNCTQCQACIAVCPVDAIEFGRRAKGKRRYYLFADGRQKFPNDKPQANAAQTKEPKR